MHERSPIFNPVKFLLGVSCFVGDINSYNLQEYMDCIIKKSVAYNYKGSIDSETIVKRQETLNETSCDIFLNNGRVDKDAI